MAGEGPIRPELARRCGAPMLAAFAAAALALAGCSRESVPAGDGQEAAERPPVEAKASVDTAVATTGDLITYTVSLDYDTNYDVDIPETGAEIAGFRIVDLGRRGPTERKGRVHEEHWYQLRADLVGPYVLPPVTVTFRRRDGGEEQEPQSLTTSEIFVEVESVLAASPEAEDIRDLKPLRRIEEPFPWMWVGVGGGILLLAALGALWLRWRRGRSAAAPPLPPHEVAFAALDRLRRTDFSDPEAVRRYYFAISEVVRAYVEGRFGLNATDLTTEEITLRLRDLTDLHEAQRAKLKVFLEDTDAVKFAAHEPREEDIQSTYESALSFVEETRPVETSEETAEEAAA